MSFRVELLESLKKRNYLENEIYAKLVKSNNRLFELNATLKHELNDVKLQNQKLTQDNLELLKSGGASGGTSVVGTDKLRSLEEQLLRSKDEVIDLHKRLVDQSQQVILLNKQLKEKTDEVQIKDARITEAENRIELLKSLNRDLDSKIANYEEMIKLWKDEKVESEIQYNCLMQKYDKLKEDYQLVLQSSLRFREEQIEKVNRLNELEAERLHLKLKDELEKASQPIQEPMIIVNPPNMVSVGPLNAYK